MKIIQTDFPRMTVIHNYKLAVKILKIEIHNFPEDFGTVSYISNQFTELSTVILKESKKKNTPYSTLSQGYPIFGDYQYKSNTHISCQNLIIDSELDLSNLSDYFNPKYLLHIHIHGIENATSVKFEMMYQFESLITLSVMAMSISVIDFLELQNLKMLENLYIINSGLSPLRFKNMDTQSKLNNYKDINIYSQSYDIGENIFSKQLIKSVKIDSNLFFNSFIGLDFPALKSLEIGFLEKAVNCRKEVSLSFINNYPNLEEFSLLYPYHIIHDHDSFIGSKLKKLKISLSLPVPTSLQGESFSNDISILFRSINISNISNSEILVYIDKPNEIETDNLRSFLENLLQIHSLNKLIFYSTNINFEINIRKLKKDSMLSIYSDEDNGNTRLVTRSLFHALTSFCDISSVYINDVHVPIRLFYSKKLIIYNEDFDKKYLLKCQGNVFLSEYSMVKHTEKVNRPSITDLFDFFSELKPDEDRTYHKILSAIPFEALFLINMRLDMVNDYITGYLLNHLKKISLSSLKDTYGDYLDMAKFKKLSEVELLTAYMPKAERKYVSEYVEYLEQLGFKVSVRKTPYKVKKHRKGVLFSTEIKED